MDETHGVVSPAAPQANEQDTSEPQRATWEKPVLIPLAVDRSEGDQDSFDSEIDYLIS